MLDIMFFPTDIDIEQFGTALVCGSLRASAVSRLPGEHYFALDSRNIT